MSKSPERIRLGVEVVQTGRVSVATVAAEYGTHPFTRYFHGSAIRHPDDQSSPEIGRALAVARALAKLARYTERRALRASLRQPEPPRPLCRWADRVEGHTFCRRLKGHPGRHATFSEREAVRRWGSWERQEEQTRKTALRGDWEGLLASVQRSEPFEGVLATSGGTRLVPEPDAVQTVEVDSAGRVTGGTL